MIGMTYDEFYNKLYYGADIDIEYNNEFYQINSGIDIKKNNTHSISVNKYNKPYWEDTPTKCIELFNISSNSTENNINLFFNSPIFDKKKFMDIEQEVIVKFG